MTSILKGPVGLIGLSLLLFFVGADVFAHGVDKNTEQFLLSNQGVAIPAFSYIGAKHMVTGYDHLLFLIGVIFFLFRTKDVLNLCQSIYARTQFDAIFWRVRAYSESPITIILNTKGTYRILGLM